MAGIAWVNYYQRTQADVVGDAVAQHAEPGDVVVYCPDQLGPDYSRQMPDGLVELAYPALSSPERVDWVDYAERNRAADPARIAEEIRDRADGNAIFVVWMSDYRTLGDQCERLLAALGPTEALVNRTTRSTTSPRSCSGCRPAGSDRDPGRSTGAGHGPELPRGRLAAAYRQEVGGAEAGDPGAPGVDDVAAVASAEEGGHGTFLLVGVGAVDGLDGAVPQDDLERRHAGTVRQDGCELRGEQACGFRRPLCVLLWITAGGREPLWGSHLTVR